MMKMKVLDGVIVNNRRGFGPVQLFCLLFILCVFCVSTTHFIRNKTHGAFRFNAGTVREGAIGGGKCEPKDIISLGDALSTDPIISGIETRKKMSEIIHKTKDDELKTAWGAFEQFVMSAKAAATMRSKPDEQHIRAIMAKGAADKNIDCGMFESLKKKIETTSLSADQKNTIKKYATEMANMGQCLGWCK
jgi:hypothetical protein